MDINDEILLNGLIEKVEFLISKYEQTRGERDGLSKELAECKEKLDISNQKIKELEQKIDNLQLIEAFKASTSDVKEAKKNIDGLIKEIDECIALLS